MCIQLMNVQTVASVVHVGVASLSRMLVLTDYVAVNLDGLRPVSFLGVELASVHAVADIDGLHKECGILLVMTMMSVVRMLMMS